MKDLGTWRRAAAASAAQSSPPEIRNTETERRRRARVLSLQARLSLEEEGPLKAQLPRGGYVYIHCEVTLTATSLRLSSQCPPPCARSPSPSRPSPAKRAQSPTRMKFIAAYLLAVLGGNLSPSAEDLAAILESVGCEVDNEKMEFLLSQLSGKDITELIAAGREKFASVPCGGGGVAVAAAAPAAGGAAPAAEAKKEEKVEEKEESDDDMGFSLFD